MERPHYIGIVLAIFNIACMVFLIFVIATTDMPDWLILLGGAAIAASIVGIFSDVNRNKRATRPH